MYIKSPNFFYGSKISFLKDRMIENGYNIKNILNKFDISIYRMWKMDLIDTIIKMKSFTNKVPNDTLDVLIQIFLLNKAIKKSELIKYFDGDEIRLLVEANVFYPTEDRKYYKCYISFIECEGLIIATDSYTNEFSDNINTVMPLLAENFECASCRPIRAGAKKILDLCTGSGLYALLYSKSYKNITGIDISERAISFAEFNKSLNKIKNVKFIQGNLYEPVKNESFDIIIANPPYMPVKSSKPSENFFSGGEYGDAIILEIIKGLDKHLNPGGICQQIHMIVNYKPFKERITDALGKNSTTFSTIVWSDPIKLVSKHLNCTAEFGLSSIRKNKTKGYSYTELPFINPFPFNLESIFDSLSGKDIISNKIISALLKSVKEYCIKNGKYFNAFKVRTEPDEALNADLPKWVF